MRLATWAMFGLLAITMMGCGGGEPEPQIAKVPEQAVAPPPQPPAAEPEPAPQEPVPAADSTAETPAETPAEPTPEAPAEPVADLQPSPPEVAPPQIADDPAGLVKQVASELAEGRPQILWYALPDSYQHEVFVLFAQQANKADPQIWAAVFDVLSELVATLKEKKDAVYDYPGLFDLNVDLLVFDSYYDPTVEVLSAISESKLKNLEDAKKINFGDLLANAGPQLTAFSNLLTQKMFELELADLKTVTAEVTNEEGDVATVKVELPGQFSKEIEFVKVEGKWTPKVLAENWAGYMDMARNSVGKLPVSADDKKKRDMSLAIMQTAKNLVTTARKAKTDERFYSTIDLVLRLAGYELPDRKIEGGNVLAPDTPAGETANEPSPPATNP